MIRHFSYSELTRTNTGLANEPKDINVLLNLVETAKKLDRIREQFGFAVRVNCAYRSAAVNAKVGGVSTSAHLDGRAADICAGSGIDMDNRRLWSICKSSLAVLGIDQLILYTANPGDEKSKVRFVHVGFPKEGIAPRMMVLYK